MYHVSAQGVDERMINVHYYYYYRPPRLQTQAANIPVLVNQEGYCQPRLQTQAAKYLF